MLDFLLNNEIPIGRLSALDFLPTQNELSRQLKSYLIACKVEGKSPATLTIYHNVISYFIEFVKKNNLPQNLTEITSTDIRSFLLSCQSRGASPSTTNAYYRTLNTFFNWLVAEGFLSRSPMQNIKPPRIPRKIIKPFSTEDIHNLLLLCSGNTFVDKRNRAMILRFLDTGLRLAELANIQLKDVNFDNETIKVMGKGAKERLVRIGKMAQRALLSYLLSRHDDHCCLWLTEERTPITKHGIKTAISRLCRRAGIKDTKLGPHTFRHTAAIQFLRNGGGEFALQLMLGHSTLHMTRRYVSTLGQDDVIRVHKMASPVDNLLRNKKTPLL